MVLVSKVGGYNLYDVYEFCEWNFISMTFVNATTNQNIGSPAIFPTNDIGFIPKLQKTVSLRCLLNYSDY